MKVPLESVKGIDRERCLEAMKDELASLTENGFFLVVAVALTGKWVLKIKRGAQGEIEGFIVVHFVC